MEVSGVLMSWETFVMSSVFMRSARVCSSTAFWIPERMLCRFSSCFFSAGSQRGMGLPL